MKRRRVLFTGLPVLMVFVAVALYLLAERIRYAPLQTGSSAILEVTAEMTAGEIPFGVPGRDIALMSDRDGSWDIYLLTADGTLKNLTTGTDNDAAFDYFPSWAMDGQQLNFISNRLKSNELGPSQIAPDGTGLQSLDILSAIMSLAMSGRFDWDPVGSPDGHQLLWSSLRDLNLELYLMDTRQPFDIGHARNLTHSRSRDWFAAWSPDGRWITFSSDDKGNENVYLLNPDSGETTQLTDNAWDELRAGWSLTGDTLLYVSDENEALLNGTVNLALMGADGSNKRALGDEVFEGGRVWSPDGQQAACVSNRSGEWQIFVMNTDGTNQRRITQPGANYLYPVWRPQEQFSRPAVQPSVSRMSASVSKSGRRGKTSRRISGIICDRAVDESYK